MLKLLELELGGFGFLLHLLQLLIGFLELGTLLSVLGFCFLELLFTTLQGLFGLVEVLGKGLELEFVLFVSKL